MPPLAPLAEIFGQPAYEFIGLVGGTTMAFAAWLKWRLSWLCSDVEEEEKDAKITARQAQNRLRVLRLMVPLLMLVGMGLLVFAARNWVHRLPF